MEGTPLAKAMVPVPRVQALPPGRTFFFFFFFFFFFPVSQGGGKDVGGAPKKKKKRGRIGGWEGDLVFCWCWN